MNTKVRVERKTYGWNAFLSSSCAPLTWEESRVEFGLCIAEKPLSFNSKIVDVEWKIVVCKHMPVMQQELVYAHIAESRDNCCLLFEMQIFMTALFHSYVHNLIAVFSTFCIIALLTAMWYPELRFIGVVVTTSLR